MRDAELGGLVFAVMLEAGPPLPENLKLGETELMFIWGE